MPEETVTCPYCGGHVPRDTTICPDCQEDLAGLLRLEYAHAVYYNEALAAAREGDLTKAGQKLALALEMKEDFAPAHLLLAKLAAQEKRWAEAKKAVARAFELVPDDGATMELAQEIEQAIREEQAAQQTQIVTRQRRTAHVLKAYQRDVAAAFVLGLGVAGAIAMISFWLGGHQEEEEDE